MKNLIALFAVLFITQFGFSQSDGTKKLQANQKAEVAKLVTKQAGAINELKADRDKRIAPINAAQNKAKAGYEADLKNYTKIYGQNSADVKRLTTEHNRNMVSLDNQKKQINTNYNKQAKTLTTSQAGAQNKLINRQGKETTIANKRDAAQKQNALNANKAMVNISRKTDAQNQANISVKNKLVNKQTQESNALSQKNAKMEGAIVRGQQNKLLQNVNDHNTNFTKRLNDPKGKPVPVSDLPRIKNSIQTDKAFKQTNKLVQKNTQANAKEKKALTNTQNKEKKALTKKIKKNNTIQKKETKSAIKKASSTVKKKAKVINEKANKAVKKVRKGRKG